MNEKSTFLEKFFYYLGRAFRPFAMAKMKKKNPELMSRLEKARDDVDKHFSK